MKWALLTLVLAVGCAKQDKGDAQGKTAPAVTGGWSDPDALAKELMARAEAGDISGLFAPEGLVKALGACSGAGNFTEELASGQKTAKAEMAKKPPGAKLAWTAGEQRDLEKHPRGSNWHGCTLNTDVDLLRYKISFEMTLDTKTLKRNKDITLVRAGGSAWFLMALT